jgi:2'-5' RNA ligase
MPGERYAVAIPFPELAGVVDEWREATCATKPSHGVAPHVTLLIPAPPDLDTARAALAGFGAFDVAFSGFGRFPGTLWLAPEPAETFVAMTEALIGAFPNHPPYEGAFESITPHLTVAQGDDLDAAETALAAALPLRAKASRVIVYEKVAADRWREMAELSL